MRIFFEEIIKFSRYGGIVISLKYALRFLRIAEFITSPNKSAVCIRASRDVVLLENAVKLSAKISNSISSLSTTVPWTSRSPRSEIARTSLKREHWSPCLTPLCLKMTRRKAVVHNETWNIFVKCFDPLNKRRTKIEIRECLKHKNFVYRVKVFLKLNRQH